MKICSSFFNNQANKMYLCQLERLRLFNVTINFLFGETGFLLLPQYLDFFGIPFGGIVARIFPFYNFSSRLQEY
ncbi:hypothetical protein BpHYR1_043690 [Brachionus plicatilis]|uniref:Uncharacterized protein n=1 Tax=Brachionus plicatilis TaxID=10195 RepID=A0A3M7RQI4_BRAPC|nr:hypothetical protein BpHYR1_043690 [Brachionus plicatilis]